jgi:hypothetical protein
MRVVLELAIYYIFQIDVRYQSMKDYSYTISCLFAGIYIADVSVHRERTD